MRCNRCDALQPMQCDAMRCDALRKQKCHTHTTANGLRSSAVLSAVCCAPLLQPQELAQERDEVPACSTNGEYPPAVRMVRRTAHCDDGTAAFSYSANALQNVAAPVHRNAAIMQHATDTTQPSVPPCNTKCRLETRNTTCCTKLTNDLTVEALMTHRGCTEGATQDYAAQLPHGADRTDR
jgi:hypothetical protein